MANPKEKVYDLAGFNQILPKYKLLHVEGPAHSKIFSVRLTLGEQHWEADGTSIKMAQQTAATSALAETTLPKPARNKGLFQDKSKKKKKRKNISPPHQPKRIKMEQPEHKVTSLAHPKPIKREHAHKSTSSCGPMASLNNAGTKENTGVLRPRVLNHAAVPPHQHTCLINREQLAYYPPPAKREHAVKSISSGGPLASLNNSYTKVNAGALHNVSNLAITTQQHKRINSEQPEHDCARSAHTEPTEREHADKSTSSGGPVAKRIKTEQPEHKVASSVQPKPTKRGHADRSTSRPTVENEWLQKKLAYIDMVKRHMTEHPADAQISTVTHAKTELLNLMTHVAGQPRSDSTQWQHPSDLTCRKYRRRFEQRAPVVPLGAWKEQNSKIGRRFYRVPHSFHRTPVLEYTDELDK